MPFATSYIDIFKIFHTTFDKPFVSNSHRIKTHHESVLKVITDWSLTKLQIISFHFILNIKRMQTMTEFFTSIKHKCLYRLNSSNVCIQHTEEYVLAQHFFCFHRIFQSMARDCYKVFMTVPYSIKVKMSLFFPRRK